MNEKNASQDAYDNNSPSSRPGETPTEENPQFLKNWDRLWERVVKLGLGDIALRAGSALVTIGLIGLIIWVMKGFFLSGEMAAQDSQSLALQAAQSGSGVGLPAYEGVAPVEGLSRSIDTHTEAQAGSRYDFISYEVVEGDSIWTISQNYGLKIETILWSNRSVLYDNPAAIYPGQVIKIPPEDGVVYVWHAGDGLNGVAKGLGVEPEEIVNWPGNGLSMETIGDFAFPNIEPGREIFAPGGKTAFINWTDTIFLRSEEASARIWGEGKCEPTNQGPIGYGTYVWPTTDHYIGGYEFSPETNHWGIDVSGKTGNPIFAVDNGVIVYAGWHAMGYGNVIALDHGNGMQSLYAHLNAFNVACGAFVYQGDIIGYLGNTGNSSGPHLHFELLSGRTRVNPHKYLTK